MPNIPAEADSQTAPGIDRVSVSFPVRDYTPDRSAWTTITEVLPGRTSTVAGPERCSDLGMTRYGTTVQLGHAECFIGVSVIRATGATHGKVEVNPSKVAGKPWEMAAVEETLQVVDQAVAQAEGMMEIALSTIQEARVRRLDVGRDFHNVDRSSELIRSLAPVPRRWARRNLVHSDPQRNGAQTLMVGSAAGVARLYDKHAETKGQAPAGTIRFEAECRKDWLAKYGGIERLADIIPINIKNLAADRWRWSAMGAQVCTMPAAVARVLADTQLTEREKTTFLGYLLRQAQADSLGVRSSRTLAKYRKAQDRLGLVLYTDLAESRPLSIQLDWNLGAAA